MLLPEFAYVYLDMALLDCLDRSWRVMLAPMLDLLGNRYVFEFINPMIYNL